MASLSNEHTLQSVSSVTELQYLLNRSNPVHNPSPDHWVIGLSIDGGGCRGVIPAQLINTLCSATNYRPDQMFSSIGGTSIGGILAGGLCASRDGKRPVMDFRDCPDLFFKSAPVIFGSRRNRIDPMGILASKYDPSGLDSVINGFLYGLKLSQCLNNLVIPAVHKDSYEIQVFRSSDAFLDPQKDYML